MRHSDLATIRARATVFAALGDETRLAVFSKLASGQRQSVSRLTEGTGITRQAISKHLRVLEDAGVVRSERAGRETLYVLDPKPIAEMQRYLSLVSAQWTDALARLKAHVEG